MAFSLAAILIAAGGVQASSHDDPTEADNWFEADYDAALSEDLSEISLEGEVDVHKIERPEMDDPWVNAALERECGDSCTAQDLREIYTSNEDQQDRLVEALEDHVEARTTEMFSSITSEDPTVNATVDRSSLAQEPEGTPYEPTVLVNVTGQGDLALLEGLEYSQDQVAALFQMGARADVPVDLPVDAGTNLTLELTVPAPLSVLNAEHGSLGEDAETVDWTVDNWESTEAVTVSDHARIGDETVVVPETEDLQVDVTVDLSTVDVHYLAALTGDTPATVAADIQIDGQLRALEVPAGTMPGPITLDVLSADAVRIAMDHELLPEQRLVAFEEESRQALEQLLTGLAAEDIQIEGGFLVDTLAPDAVGEPSGSGPPIQLDVSGQGIVPLPPEEDPLGASAFEITRVHQGVLELPAIPTPGDRPANVTLVLPQGIDFDFEDIDQGSVATSTTEEGLTAVTFTAGGEEGPTTVQGAEFVVNSPFVWDLLWPVIVFLFLVLVVLPAVVIYLVIRRRRGKEGDSEPKKSRIPGGYEAQPDPDASPSGDKDAAP